MRSHNVIALLACTSVLISTNTFSKEYEVTKGDSLSKILKNKGYGETHTELQPYIEQIKSLNSEYFVSNDENHILPGMVIQLPKHPDDIVVPEPITEKPIVEEPAIETPAPVTIGNMTVKRGAAYIVRNGKRIKAQKLNGLQTDDLINTDNSTNVVIVLLDGSRYELGSNTEFKIDEYDYTPQEQQTTVAKINTSIITLLKGVARTFTGKIGKLQTDKYKFRTRTVTIGIRGTEFTTRFCDGDQCGSFPGASVAVTDGVIDAANKSGTVSLKQDEFISVSKEDTKFEVTAIPEGFLDIDKNVTELKPTPWWQKVILWFKTATASEQI